MRFWKFGIFILCCSCFGLQGCTTAEEATASPQETNPLHTSSEIQKIEISLYHKKYFYELIMKRSGENVHCTLRTMQSKYSPAPQASNFMGMRPIMEASEKKRIFPRGCSFAVDEKTLSAFDQLLQKGGITAVAASQETNELKPLRFLYVEYKNGKHITLNRLGKDSSFLSAVPYDTLVEFMEKLASDNGQKLYDGNVLLGPLLQCSYSSAGSSSGGHHFIDITRQDQEGAIYESRFMEWHNSPEKTQKKIISAQLLDEIETLGQKYKIETWKPFPKTDLIALDAPTVTLTVKYGEPWSWIKWDLSMSSYDELNEQQQEYYRKVRTLLMK